MSDNPIRSHDPGNAPDDPAPGTPQDAAAHVLPPTAFRSLAVVSPLAVRFGHRDPDAVRASALRAVQDTAKTWQDRHVPLDPDISDSEDPRPTVTSGIADAVRAAHDHAVRVGVPLAEIHAARDLGMAGVSWDQLPGHPLLGRLERLAHELTVADARANSDRGKIRALEHDLAQARGRNADLAEDLAHARNDLAAGSEQIAEATWVTGHRHHDREPGPQPARTLDRANAELALANDLDALDRGDTHGLDPSPPPGPSDAGHGIGAAIDTALPHEPGPWTGDTTPHADPTPNGTDHGPEVTS
ncbi:hypothetical protein [Nocardia nova]|uniref:hypothetical protein n=1 Tax=Nocardia nova TaxID=37330 RepID=UPI0034062CEB